MYARGILFGKMKYELGDHSLVKCPELGLVADLEFKTKGYFSGSYNAIGGVIKEIKTDKHLFELSGYWHGEMFIKDLKVRNYYLEQLTQLDKGCPGSGDNANKSCETTDRQERASI